MRDDIKLKIQENKRKLISNLHPVKRLKGYSSYESIHKNTLLNIAEVILQINSNEIGILNIQDSQIWNVIFRSYEKISKGVELSGDDFILCGHEIDEFIHIPQRDIVRYCIYRYKYNKFPQNFTVSDYPPCVQIEITSMCNFRCIMCYQSDETFTKKSNGFIGFMSMDLFKKCIDELEGNVEAVTFASRGEPLLHPLLPEMLEYCRGKFLALKLNTNASLLDEKMSYILLDSDLQTLVLSIDAATKEIYEKIRVNGNFDRVVKNIKSFDLIRRNSFPNGKLNVRVSGVKINDEQNLDDMSNFFENYVDSSAFVNYNPWETAYSNGINKLTQPCSELFRRMFVWWDGTVNPCDYDYKSTLSAWKFGSNPLSLGGIWNSIEYQNLRDIHLSGRRPEKEPCARCVSA